MIQLIKVEIYKLKHSRGFKVLMGLSAFLGVFGVIAATAMGEGVNLSGHDTFYKQFGDLKSLTFVLIGVFSGLFIGEDFANRTLQSQISLGYSRFLIIFSKTMVYMMGVFALIFIEVFVASMGTSWINGFGVPITMSLVLEMLRALLAFSFLMCSSAVICVATAFIIKNKGTMIAINMLLLVIIDGILVLLASQFVFFQGLYENSTFYLVLNVAGMDIANTVLINALLVAFVSMVGYFSLAYLFFRRGELK
jgi:ABC-type transport system involved in multi-copper enzyme maturation permease subunit